MLNSTFLLRLALNRYLSCRFYFDPVTLARRNNNTDPTNGMANNGSLVIPADVSKNIQVRNRTILLPFLDTRLRKRRPLGDPILRIGLHGINFALQSPDKVGSKSGRARH